MRAALTRLRRVRRGGGDAVPLSPSSRAAPPRVLGDPIPLPPEVAGESEADFRALGDEIYRYLVTFCRMRPTHRVLDVKCGYAPLARPLSRWLIEGGYDGIDTNHRVLVWCRQNISSTFPTFRFFRLEADGGIRYPFHAGTFDCVVVWDVITRAAGPELEQHIAETARVLRRGRWALFGLRLGQRPSDGTDLVVHDEGNVRQLLERHALEVVEPVERGRWSGPADALAETDLVVVRKPLPPRAAAAVSKPHRRVARLVRFPRR